MGVCQEPPAWLGMGESKPCMACCNALGEGLAVSVFSHKAGGCVYPSLPCRILNELTFVYVSTESIAHDLGSANGSWQNNENGRAGPRRGAIRDCRLQISDCR